MSSRKAFKLAEKAGVQQRQILDELEAVTKSIERGERMIAELKAEIDAVNLKHVNRKTTREDVAYLEDVLRCAKSKLAWEDKMASLGKRIPAVLARVTAVMSDEINPPSEAIRDSVVKSLSAVQSAMERLQKAKGE